jgi:hypothetical protein
MPSSKPVPGDTHAHAAFSALLAGRKVVPGPACCLGVPWCGTAAAVTPENGEGSEPGTPRVFGLRAAAEEHAHLEVDELVAERREDVFDAHLGAEPRDLVVADVQLRGHLRRLPAGYGS